MSNKAKPYLIQWRVTRGAFARICGDWSTLRRYRTREDAEKALASHERKEAGHWGKAGFMPRDTEYRLISPEEAA